MKKRLPLAVLGAALLVTTPALSSEKSAYDFSFKSIDGGPLPLARYRDKVVLVVNTASFCGFTHQYANLQTVWKRYRARGLVVVGVPSNDFGQQEPGTKKEIKHFCKVNFNITFPLADKVRVKGAARHPFYSWAESVLGARSAPRWNFHKYLVGRDGKLIAWFPTAVSPTSKKVTDRIEAALAKRPTN